MKQDSRTANKMHRQAGTLAIYKIGLVLLAAAILLALAGCGKKQETSRQDVSMETEKIDMASKEISTPIQESESEITPAVQTTSYQDTVKLMAAGEDVEMDFLEASAIPCLFYQASITDEIKQRIMGISYTENPSISLEQLSYLRMLYYGFDEKTHVGEMIVNQEIAEDVLAIFQELYEKQYPIEKMVLVDEYQGDDESSMGENNTSAFNYRTISGSSKLSNHSFGMAVDLNPKYNPYVRTKSDGTVTCQPSNGSAYADRSKTFEHKITKDDLAYQLFTQAGFTWGGDWNSVKDYQHFEKVH